MAYTVFDETNPRSVFREAKRVDLGIFGVFWVSGGFRPPKAAFGAAKRGGRWPRIAAIFWVDEEHGEVFLMPSREIERLGERERGNR